VPAVAGDAATRRSARTRQPNSTSPAEAAAPPSATSASAQARAPQRTSPARADDDDVARPEDAFEGGGSQDGGGDGLGEPVGAASGAEVELAS
jgi:hypothetical protein